MSKIALLATFFLWFGNVSAQTKPKQTKLTLEETVNWIVQKLNSNNAITFYVKEPIHTLIKNENFKLDEKQSISFILTVSSTDFNSPLKENKLVYSVLIPINQIDKIEYAEDFMNLDLQDTAKNTYLKIDTYEKGISEKNVETNTIEYVNTIKISLDFTHEVNLLQRLQKAFTDLKSHFAKKQEAY